jgi:hypothetical protein
LFKRKESQLLTQQPTYPNAQAWKMMILMLTEPNQLLIQNQKPTALEVMLHLHKRKESQLKEVVTQQPDCLNAQAWKMMTLM